MWRTHTLASQRRSESRARRVKRTSGLLRNVKIKSGQWERTWRREGGEPLAEVDLHAEATLAERQHAAGAHTRADLSHSAALPVSARAGTRLCAVTVASESRRRGDRNDSTPVHVHRYYTESLKREKGTKSGRKNWE